ncbi:hypothetical protein EK0264_05490 [Epidermidibacterium keratini]|uniref:Cytochrome P450 n=1 Tax=Epidermidibacterium keratini TaxID=1891644 RepID=A0A7L4YKJ3_9ACTN|nr:hypothetical protein [Epidermidibacterium keratini]QHB99784.1 hypothetical protein EK0264_05490 [Epidermidibacterium keratini]
MTTQTSSALSDPAYAVPTGPAGESGLAWLRHHVPRFTNGARHARLRTAVEAVIAAVDDAPYTADPTTTLLTALGLPRHHKSDVERVAGAYQPHVEQSAAADAAADRLLAACGGRTDDAAAKVCVLVQAHAGITALLATTDGPPIPRTRRVGPDGDVEVDLADAPFGAGAHRCPGERLGRRLAEEAGA